MMSNFQSKHSIGDIVYLITDSYQLERIITMISFKGSGACVYSISCADLCSEHYDFEISAQRDINKVLDIIQKEKQ